MQNSHAWMPRKTTLIVALLIAQTGCSQIGSRTSLRPPAAANPQTSPAPGPLDREAAISPAVTNPSEHDESSTEPPIVARGQSPGYAGQNYTAAPVQYEEYDARSIQPSPPPYQPQAPPAQPIPQYDPRALGPPPAGPVLTSPPPGQGWGPPGGNPPGGDPFAAGAAQGNPQFVPGPQGVPGQPLVGQQPYPVFGQPGSPAYEPADRYVDIEGRASETQTGRFMFGVGVNSDAGVVGSIVLDEQNFDWQRVPYSWEEVRNGTAFRGAGQRFRIEAAPGTEVQRYLFDFKEPYLFETPVSLGLSGFFYDRRFRDWDEERLGGRVTLGYQFSPDLSGAVALRAEQIDITRPAVPTPPELLEVLGQSALYSVRTQIAHDTRDNTFLATEGHYVEVGFEQAFGDFTFPRATLDARRFFTLTERPDGSGRQVLSVTGRLGVTGSDTPLYERFFAGGASSLRGFDFRGASPVNMGVIVGGDFQMLGSVEYMFPITADDMLRGVTFVDFGTVEDDVRFDADTFRIAPGFGLRVTIPALGPAPIALDFAFPVNRADTDDTQVFSFFVGFGR